MFMRYYRGDENEWVESERYFREHGYSRRFNLVMDICAVSFFVVVLMGTIFWCWMVSR